MECFATNMKVSDTDVLSCLQHV